MGGHSSLLEVSLSCYFQFPSVVVMYDCTYCLGAFSAKFAGRYLTCQWVHYSLASHTLSFGREGVARETRFTTGGATFYFQVCW
jgi:hypothetical protein